MIVSTRKCLQCGERKFDDSFRWDEFRLVIEVPKELCAIPFLIADSSYLFVNTWTPKLNSNALKTWPQWTFTIAVNIGNDSN